MWSAEFIPHISWLFGALRNKFRTPKGSFAKVLYFLKASVLFEDFAKNTLFITNTVNRLSRRQKISSIL